ncbi:hypothetical protein GCM10008935_28020 [Alkalibacillus silvisoli]|uniref:DUF4871 domain-containing protein n=1 Tax=Alkalibacillus silvisoli TaxID=392823 RepID=A0ABP3K3H6_9BACI
MEKETSPTFSSHGQTMIGQENKIGFIYGEDIPLIAGEEQKYMWHLWGEPEELEGKFEVIGTNEETGKRVNVFETEKLGGPNNGADAHAPSSFSLPSSGIWELEAHVGNERFETLVVEVK